MDGAIMPERYVVVGLRAKKGKAEELRRDLAAVVDPSRKEEGSLRYELFVDESDPELFVFVEQWASAELQDRHHSEGVHIRHFQEHGAVNVEKTEFVHMLTRVA